MINRGQERMSNSLGSHGLAAFQFVEAVSKGAGWVVTTQRKGGQEVDGQPGRKRGIDGYGSRGGAGSADALAAHHWPGVD